MRGVDYKTGHQYHVSPLGGEVHSDECDHPDHYSTIAVPPDNATFDADTVRRMTEHSLPICVCGHTRSMHHGPFGQCLGCAPLNWMCENFKEKSCRSTDAEVRQHGAEQLRKDWDALMAEFYGDTERQAIESVAPEPPKRDEHDSN